MLRRKRALRLAILSGTLALAVASSAGAAPLSHGPEKVASGGTGVSPCGALTGVTATYSASGGLINQVTLTNIPAACNGGGLRATLTAGTTSLGGGGPVTVAGGSATVAVSPSVAPSSATNLYLSVAGP